MPRPHGNERKVAQAAAQEGCRASFRLWLLSPEGQGFLPKNRYLSEGYQMSGTFEKREKGFEAKWAHDEELRFKVYARRNKLLGLWAAAEMGIIGPAADAYAKEVVTSDFERAGDEDVFE